MPRAETETEEVGDFVLVCPGSRGVQSVSASGIDIVDGIRHQKQALTFVVVSSPIE